MTAATLAEKHDALRAILKEAGRVAVAFSGGADSALLLCVAHEVLGKDAVALTGVAPMVPERETEQARTFCQERGIEQVIVDAHLFELEGFADNPENRCYLCKRALFSAFAQTAGTLGIETIVEGSNVDDAAAWRPGMRALEELRIESPLAQAGLSKAEVRALSRELGLPTWDKPSASCLMSRFAYGTHVGQDDLSRVDAAEEALRALGFAQVRVRVAGDDARIEVEAENIAWAASEDVRSAIVQKLGALGYVHVSLDLQGYRFGSMDEKAGHTAP